MPCWVLGVALLAADFRFAIVGDRTGTAAPGVYEAAWRAVTAAQPAFVVTIGDHIEGGRDAVAETEWEALAPVWRSAGVPVWFVAGNHDIWSPSSRRLHEKYTGRPATYSFEHGDAHFAVLDNAQSLAVPEAQLDWLEKDLAAHTGAAVKAVFFHQPGWVMPVMLGQTEFRLHRIAKRFGVSAIVSGHTHQYLRRELEGVTYLTVPSAAGTYAIAPTSPTAGSTATRWWTWPKDACTSAFMNSARRMGRAAERIPTELMSQELREKFNRDWTPEKYERLLQGLEADLGFPVPFRLNETPCFFGQDLADRLCTAGTDLIRQITDSDEYFRASDPAIPEHYRVPNEAPYPMFTQVDFGLVRGADGRFEPRLVEIQGFPSLYAFQPMLAEHYRRAYGLPGDLRYLMSRLERPRYDTLLRKAIVGRHDPENVILLEIDPEHQKTRCDFVATERVTGVKTVCITKLKQEGNKLFYPGEHGIQIPVHRIYNRAIVDELERKGVEVPFRWNDDLDVEWAGHPNWYFRLSKFSLPFLTHPSVPETLFFDQVDRLPDDPENWVLKPLFSFAGLGVIVGPTREELDAVKDRANYILQRRVRFDPAIETPHGPTMVEIRVMFLWLEGAKNPLPVNTILRTGRGKMMGVDHNKGLEWVGASAAFYV